jgi:MoxR-like ATPase
MATFPNGKPADLPLAVALFRKKTPHDFFPAVDAHTLHATLARRNAHPNLTENSLLLVKALLAALCGKVNGLYDLANAVVVESDSPDRQTQSGKPAKTSVALAKTTGPFEVWSLFGSTYHIGLAALGEAVVRANEAPDLLDAWCALVEYRLSVFPASFEWEKLASLHDFAFNELLLRAADELYFWTRYANAEQANCVADGPNDRIANAVVHKEIPQHSRAGAPNLADLLLDPAKLRQRAQDLGQPQPTPPEPEATASRFAGFYGPQLKQLVDAITRAVPTLLYGPTGTGKSVCEMEAMRLLTTPPVSKSKRKAAPTPFAHERVDGKEGMEDIDLIGAIVPQGADRVWVDGPLARAFRRAQTEKVVLFVDEITTIPTAHTNLLKGALNPTPRKLLELQGVTPQGNSPSDKFYYLEIPQTTEILTAPVENLAVVAACNLGSQYAVHPLDPALERRFQFHLEFGYLSIQDEANLIAERTGLAPKLALACARVAAKTREKAENAEVADALDPASLLVWAGEIARANPKTAAEAQKVFVETARYTWLPRVVGRDHRGLVPKAKAQGIEDAIIDQAKTAFLNR